jgi:uncharacterized repeat protein (TIGR02543 family)
MKRIILAGFLFITFAFFYAFEEPSHSSFDAQQESIFGINKYDSTKNPSNSGPDQWAKTYRVSLVKDGDRWSTDWGFGYAGSIRKTRDQGYILVTGMLHSTYKRGCTLVLKLNSYGDIEWQRAYLEHFSAYWHSIQQTRDGGYIISTQTLSYGAGDFDIMIFKLNSLGDIEWQRTYGEIGEEIGYCSIQETSDGGYIYAGCFYSDVIWGGWIFKLNPSGDIEWERYYKSPCDGFWRIQQTSDGGYIVLGSYYSDKYGRFGTWIMKLTSSGDAEWQRFYDVTQYSGRISLGNSDIKQTSDEGYIVSLSTVSYGAGGIDIMILKLNSYGDIEWQRTYGGIFDDGPSYSSNSIEQTSDGGFVVGGKTESFGAGESDLWILKLTPTGDIEWQHTYGGRGREDFLSIQETSDGGCIVGGYRESFGGTSILILKLSSNGEIGPSCGIVGSSNAAISDTSITPLDTNEVPVELNAITMSTSIQPYESDAVVHNLCPGPHTLILSATAGGTTNPEPGTYTYDGGAEVTIKATANDGYRFSGWSGDSSATYSPIQIAMDSDKSITANFTKIEEEDKKGDCFIATAAYGSPLHSYVRILRDFRDTYLMPTKLGRKFVELYYKYSPFVVDLIAKHKVLKAAVRIHLLSLVAFSYSMLHFGPLITVVLIVFIFILPIFLISFFQRKLRRIMSTCKF